MLLERRAGKGPTVEVPSTLTLERYVAGLQVGKSEQGEERHGRRGRICAVVEVWRERQAWGTQRTSLVPVHSTWGAVGQREHDHLRASGFNPAGQRGHLAQGMSGGIRIPVSWPYTVGIVAVFK